MDYKVLTADNRDENLSGGYIGLQAKGRGEISFLNIRLEELNVDKTIFCL